MTAKHPLDRLLRVRSLLADVSRVELESCLQELAQVEYALMHMEETGKVMRRRSFGGIIGAQSEDWLEAQVLGEWLGWEKEIFEKARRQKMTEVDAAKAVYLERRKECRQVESVIDAKASVAAMEYSRREQRELDDWFGQRSRFIRKQV
jgi:flagellar biosynthesis chaperone FliJ